MDSHAGASEVSSVFSPCENGVRWLRAFSVKLTAIHHLQYISLFQEKKKKNGHDKREDRLSQTKHCTHLYLSKDREKAELFTHGVEFFSPLVLAHSNR